MRPLLRPMRAADVDAVLDVQEPGSVRALSTIFPQDLHPFPRTALRERWLEEIADPDIDCLVAEVDEQLVGFVAAKGTELLHFGTAVPTWGTGLAGRIHDEALQGLRRRGVGVAWLRVFEANTRARRFYERRGWRATGSWSRSSFAPYPVLIHYELALGVGAGSAGP